MILMTLVRHIDDPLVTAALLGETTMPPHATPPHERLVYQVRDAVRAACSCARAMRRPSCSTFRWSRASSMSTRGAC